MLCLILVSCISNKMTVSCLLRDKVAQNQLCIHSHKEKACTCAVVLFFSTTPTHIQKQIEAHALCGSVWVCVRATMCLILWVYVCFYYVSEWLEFVYECMCLCALVRVLRASIMYLDNAAASLYQERLTGIPTQSPRQRIREGEREREREGERERERDFYFSIFINPCF